MPRTTARKSTRVYKQRSKNKSWKSLKIVKRIQKTLVLMFISFIAVIFSIGLLLGVSFYRFLRAPLAAGFYEPNNLDINEAPLYTTSFIVLDDKSDSASKVVNLSFLVMDVENRRVLIYNIPPNLSIDLPERYGVGEISKLYALGELVDENKGIDLINKAIEKIVAKRVDRFVLTDTEGLKSVKETFNMEEIDKLPSAFAIKNITKLNEILPVLKDKFATNFKASETINLFKFLRNISGSDIKVTELTQEDIDVSHELDKEFSDIFINPMVVDEHKRILVLNGAGVPRMGSHAARFIENFGGSIVGVDNASKSYERSVIVTDNSDSETVKLIVRELGIENVLVPEVGLELVDEQAVRADVVVIVGIDYASSL